MKVVHIRHVPGRDIPYDQKWELRDENGRHLRSASNSIKLVQYAHNKGWFVHEVDNR